MKVIAGILFMILGGMAFGQPTPEQVLAQATRYHDPHHIWPTLQATFHFTAMRPQVEDRHSTLQLDNARTYLKVDLNGTEAYEVTVNTVNILAGDKDAARGLMLRNYFLYLWGLPMKLHDPGTRFDPVVTAATIDGVPCDVVRVVYEKDTWYFSFAQKSGRMLEYKFYKDEAVGEGEVITLEGEIEAYGLRIPQKRNWYTLPANKYLGSDILDRIE